MTRRQAAAALLAFLALGLAVALTFSSRTAHAPAERRTGSPARVASLNLAADEVLAEILPPERLVGVTRLVDEVGSSNAIGRIPRSVFRFPKADMETLVSRRPDLVVISEYTDADFATLLERSGTRVHQMVGLGTFDGIRRAILELGAAVGAPEEAARLVFDFDRRRHALAERLAGAPRPRVLYWASGMTAGSGTAIGALIGEAGASNVGAELGVSGIAPIGAERAFAADPDYVLVGTWERSAEEVRAHPLLGSLRAVRERRIIALKTELLVALSHHAATAAWALAAALHPDRVTVP